MNLAEKGSQVVRNKRHITPPQTLTLSFATLILGGALLLNLPIASVSGESIGFLDALFTATSAVCVTGLIVVNTLAHWTMFGKVVILILIQLGGLGVMTCLTLAMVVLRRKVSLKDRMVIQAAFNQSGIGGMVKLVKKIVCFTLIIEAVGAVVLAIAFYFSTEITVLEAVGKGIFHSISAFCNAGFDIIGEESLTPFATNIGVIGPIMLLIVLGGIGFTVLGECRDSLRGRRNRSFKKKIQHLSLHTKIALAMTAGLLISGTILFMMLEWTNPKTLQTMNFGEKIMAAAFQSVTLRTCGFNTINQGGLTEASQFISCIYMFIGGSPAGTAGGIKTVTFGVILFSMISVFRGRDCVEAFGRTLPLDLLQKALAVFGGMLFVVIGSTLVLCFTEQDCAFQHSFLDLLFESASAAGTVGITTGITPFLSSAGKIVIIICMFLGRLSPVTVVVALNMRLNATDNSRKYIEERVIVG